MLLDEKVYGLHCRLQYSYQRKIICSQEYLKPYYYLMIICEQLNIVHNRFKPVNISYLFTISIAVSL